MGGDWGICHGPQQGRQAQCYFGHPLNTGRLAPLISSLLPLRMSACGGSKSLTDLCMCAALGPPCCATSSDMATPLLTCDSRHTPLQDGREPGCSTQGLWGGARRPAAHQHRGCCGWDGRDGRAAAHLPRLRAHASARRGGWCVGSASVVDMLYTVRADFAASACSWRVNVHAHARTFTHVQTHMPHTRVHARMHAHTHKGARKHT